MMDERYDPVAEHYHMHEWSEERQDLYFAAMHGLDDGNLEPLAVYCRSGYVLGAQLAEMIASFIEDDWTPFKLQLVGRKKGQRPTSEVRRRRNASIEIGVEVFRNLRDQAGLKMEAAVYDVATRRAVGRTKVIEAYTLVKRCLEGEERAIGSLELYQFIPEEFTVTPEGTVYRRSQ